MGPSQHPHQATMYAPHHHQQQHNQQHHHQGAPLPAYQQQQPHLVPPPPAPHPSQQRWQSHQAPQPSHHHPGAYLSAKPARAVQHPYHHHHHHHHAVAYVPHHAVPHHHHFTQPPQPAYTNSAPPPRAVQKPQPYPPTAAAKQPNPPVAAVVKQQNPPVVAAVNQQNPPVVAAVNQQKPPPPPQARPPTTQAPPAKQSTTVRPASGPPTSTKPVAVAVATRSESAPLPDVTLKLKSDEKAPVPISQPKKMTTPSVPPSLLPPKQITENKEDKEDEDFVDLEKGPDIGSNIGLENDYPRKPPRAPSVSASTATSILSNKASSAGTTTHKKAVMSPITMCFDRMLGAAEYIKTPNITGYGKKRGKKVPPLGASNGQSVAISGGSDMNPFDELAADPELERLVILQMAMQRQQSINQSAPAIAVEETACSSNIISEGFFWRDVPVCEQVLYSHMERYYEISAIQRNYKVQQHFNNVLVQEVRDAAEANGFIVDPDFDDKKLRDRIRCFYKTHLQNAKKRLATLQKHSSSPENQCLVAVFIRCVRNPNLTFQESLEMAPESCIPTNKSQQNVANKKRRLDKVEKLKRSVSQEGATTVGIVSDMAKPMV